LRRPAISPRVELVGVKEPVHDRRAPGVREQLALVSDQAARGRMKHQTASDRPLRGRISTISPLRFESFSTTMPVCSLGPTSITASSIGSISSP